MKSHIKKSNCINLVGRLIDNKKGDILALVVMIGACLFIVVAVLLTAVGSNTQTNSVINKSENAYLAAKSGLQMLKDVGTEPAIINKVYNSEDDDPIVMDFGDLGQCEVKILSTADAETTNATTGEKKKYVMAECTGVYEGERFTLKRKLGLKGTPTGSPPTGSDIPLAAYTQYSSSELPLNGSMDGHTNILGDALVTVKNATPLDPIDEFSCMGRVQFTQSDIVADIVGAGQSITADRPIVIKENLYVGAKDEDGNLKSPIFAYLIGSTVNGRIVCDGDLIVYGYHGTLNGYDGGIGVNNYNKTDHKIKSDSFNAIQAGSGAGSKVYIGYTCKVASDMLSYSDVSRKDGMNEIYGRILVNGDLYIAGTTKIYGDVICTGKVTIYKDDADGIEFHKNIYAKEVVYDDGTAYDKSHADGSAIVNTTDTAKIQSAAGGGSDAVDYFEEIKEENHGGSRPKTEFPDGVESLPSVVFANPACPDDESVAKFYTGYDGGAPKDGGYDDSRMTNLVHITKSCSIKNDINLNGWWPVNRLYIDTSVYGEDINIYLNAQLSQSDAGCIIVNDNGGNNCVKFFMEDGSKLKLGGTTCNYPGFIPVGDDYATSVTVTDGFENLPVAAMDYRIDQTKIPQLYFFARQPADPDTPSSNAAVIDIGTYGCIPGYVLTPYVDISSYAQAHCYKSGTKVGYDPNNESVKKAENVPFVYGMVMCNSAEISGGEMTSIVFDPLLEGRTGTDEEQAERMEKFQDAIEGIYFYDITGGGGGSGSSGGGSGSGGGFDWVIEDII